ncbi:unnamed protein product, partial [Rotaria sordida]
MNGSALAVMFNLLDNAHLLSRIKQQQQ